MLYSQGAQPKPATEEAWLGEVHRSVSKVFVFVLEKYTDVFQRNEIDFQLFLTMTDKELKEVGSSKPLKKYPLAFQL